MVLKQVDLFYHIHRWEGPKSELKLACANYPKLIEEKMMVKLLDKHGPRTHLLQYEFSRLLAVIWIVDRQRHCKVYVKQGLGSDAGDSIS